MHPSWPNLSPMPPIPTSRGLCQAIVRPWWTKGSCCFPFFLHLFTNPKKEWIRNLVEVSTAYFVSSQSSHSATLKLMQQLSHCKPKLPPDSTQCAKTSPKSKTLEKMKPLIRRQNLSLTFKKRIHSKRLRDANKNTRRAQVWVPCNKNAPEACTVLHI